MTPEQRSKNASNARTAREKTLLREVAHLAELLTVRSDQVDKNNSRLQRAYDEVAVQCRNSADLTMERDKYRYLSAAWRDEAMAQQTRLVEERAKRMRSEQ